MKGVIFGVCLALAAAACSDVQTPRMLAPSPSEPVAAAASITLTSVAGIGSSAGTVYVVAHVRDASGKAVGSALVHFVTTAGQMQPDAALSDGGGQAQALVITSSAATVTATAGSATGTIAVVPTAPPPAPSPSPSGPSNPPLPPLPPPAPGTPPVATPPAPAPPPPPAPAATLGVTMTCVPVAHTSPTACNLAATYGGASIPSTAIIRVDWDFGDGKSQTVTGSGAALITHAYTQAGTYRVVANTDAITVEGTKNGSGALSVVVP